MGSSSSTTVITPSRGSFVPHLVLCRTSSLHSEKVASCAREPLSKVSKKSSAWKSSEYMFFTSDIMGIPRLTTNLVNAITGKVNAIGLQALGLTAIFSVFTGTIAGVKGFKEYSKANKINDLWGKFMGGINILRAPVDILGGITFTSFRALSIAAAFTSAKVITIASTIFMQLGSSFFIVSYALIALPAAVSYVKNLCFKWKLEKAMAKEGDEQEKMREGLKILKEEFQGTEEEWNSLAQTVIGDPKIYQDEHITETLEIDRSKFNEEELKFLYQKAKEQGRDDISTERLYGHLKQAFYKFKKTKQAEFERKTGAESLAALKKECGKPANECLNAQLNSKKGFEAAKKVLTLVQEEMAKNRLLKGAMVFFCAVGVAALIAGMLSSGGTLGIAIAAIWIIATIGFLVIDGYYLYKALQSGNLEGKDKVLFFMANALLLVFSALATVFSGGLVPIIIGVITGCIWLALGTYSLAKWYGALEDKPSEINAPFLEKKRA